MYILMRIKDMVRRSRKLGKVSLDQKWTARKALEKMSSVKGKKTGIGWTKHILITSQIWPWVHVYCGNTLVLLITAF